MEPRGSRAQWARTPDLHGTSIPKLTACSNGAGRSQDGSDRRFHLSYSGFGNGVPSIIHRRGRPRGPGTPGRLVSPGEGGGHHRPRWISALLWLAESSAFLSRTRAACSLQLAVCILGLPSHHRCVAWHTLHLGTESFLLTIPALRRPEPTGPPLKPPRGGSRGYDLSTGVCR